MLTKIEDLTFYSKKQEASVNKYLAIQHPHSYYKLRKQFSDGTITLHHFFICDGKWLGYALTIGKRGGERAYHKCYVVENSNGTLDLHHS
jgi:hypothetical protein